MRTWIIQDIAEQAYRHGQGYAKSNVYRNVGRFSFKHPEAIGLPDYVIRMSLEDHQFLANVYRHAFRQGLKKGV